MMKLIKVPYFYGLDKKSSMDEVSGLLDQADKEHIALVPWPDYDYKPEVSFAIGYIADALCIKFYVHERYMQALYNNINDPVHKDSCVELFIAFDDDDNYYNLEFNSVGACSAGYGTNRDDREILPVPVIRQIGHQTLVRSAEDIINWELTLIIPKDVFCYHSFASFNDKACRVNFYKCGDDLPEPHFLTWNQVYSDMPDFHLPQFFGNMQFV